MKIYLAIPYTVNPERSFTRANLDAGKIMTLGHIVFSPISHTHPIGLACNLPMGWDYWQDFDYLFIEWCDELWVSSFGDWTKSEGVKGEIKIATQLNKKIKFMG